MLHDHHLVITKNIHFQTNQMAPVRYFGCDHPFSHLHPSPLEAAGESWDTVEQAYQHAKAVLGCDYVTADLLKHEPDGRRQKSLSHRIRNKHPRLWDIAKSLVMLRFDVEKFEQNSVLAANLLVTGTRPLLEDNRRDQFWGGSRNEAGKILQRVRSHLSGEPVLPEVLILGDSILKHLNEDQISSNLGKRTVVLSFPGAKLEYLFALAPLVVGCFISKVLIFGGTNSLTTKAEKAKQGAHELFRKIQTFEARFHNVCPVTELHLCQVLNRPRSQENHKICGHIATLNALLCEANAAMTFSPMTNVVQLSPFADAMFSDGLHLNYTGTKKLTDIFLSALEAVPSFRSC